ncbi:hypothetical protein QCA50_019316 [Cerrena zonata]|uniref:AN1-type domain-containing protein n=1 Tax=Cerrena zonata TaxID=2478898 RepID=A0AAW0FFS9_9APHY
MSGTHTPAQGPDAELLAVGQQCSEEHCHLIDFLPFKCEHCAQAFCGEHFRPQAHKCHKYDEHQHNRVAPPCPFCSTPIAIPPGEDPNIRMERHFNDDCPVTSGQSGKKSTTPHCARAKCNKVLWSPIRCDKCSQQFCPAHRFPNDHSCVSSSKATPSTSSPKVFGGTRPNTTSAASAAAMAAIKRAMNNTSSSSPARKPATSTQNKQPPPVVKPVAPKAPSKAPPAPSASSSKPASTRTNPFSATDRRAKAERESRLKAMQARAKKGLLTDEEKLILAEEEANKGKGDDCVIG